MRTESVNILVVLEHCFFAASGAEIHPRWALADGVRVETKTGLCRILRQAARER